MNEIYEIELGLLFGLINDKNNQYESQDKKEIQGTADMLKRM